MWSLNLLEIPAKSPLTREGGSSAGLTSKWWCVELGHETVEQVNFFTRATLHCLQNIVYKMAI